MSSTNIAEQLYNIYGGTGRIPFIRTDNGKEFEEMLIIDYTENVTDQIDRFEAITPKSGTYYIDLQKDSKGNVTDIILHDADGSTGTVTEIEE